MLCSASWCRVLLGRRWSHQTPSKLPEALPEEHLSELEEGTEPKEDEDDRTTEHLAGASGKSVDMSLDNLS